MATREIEHHTIIIEKVTNDLIKELECLVKELKDGKAMIYNYEQDAIPFGLPSPYDFAYTYEKTSHVTRRFSGMGDSFSRFTFSFDKPWN